MNNLCLTGAVTFVFFALCGTQKASAQSSGLIPESYLLVGQLSERIHSPIGLDDQPEPDKFDFVVARTPSRIIHGIQLASRPTARRAYSFVDCNSPFCMTFDIPRETVWENRDDILNLNGMKVSMIIRQDDTMVDNSKASPLALAESGRIGAASFAVFLGRAQCGHSLELFNGVDLQADRVLLLENAFGRLELVRENNSHSFVFNQTGDHFSKSLGERKKLSDFRSKLFPAGVTSSEEVCRFDILLNQLTTVPWTATITDSSSGPDGAHFSTSMLLEVTRFVDDAEQTNAFIDAFMARIPEGTNVVTKEKLTYEWRDRGIHVVKDIAAIQQAETVTFTPPSPWWRHSVIPICSAIVLAGLALIVRWRQTR